jgi:hypothetical protein
MKADSGNWGQNVEIRGFTTEDTENTEGHGEGLAGVRGGFPRSGRWVMQVISSGHAPHPLIPLRVLRVLRGDIRRVR